MNKELLIKTAKVLVFVTAVVLPGGLTALALYKLARKAYLKGFTDGVETMTIQVEEN